MNFPDVPFDETLFEANDMMKSYWERSTENRTENFVRDVRTEEQDLPEELRELRQLTLDSFGENQVAEKPEDLGEVVGQPEAATVDAIVRPKSVNGSTVVLWLIVGGAAVFLVVSYMHHRGLFSRSSTRRT
jgi:hypothetical protein